MNKYISEDSKLDRNFSSEVIELCLDERYEVGQDYDFSAELFNFLLGGRAIGGIIWRNKIESRNLTSKPDVRNNVINGRKD